MVPTLTHTPFISGLSTSAGEVGFRARWATRQPRRTWLYVAFCAEVTEKERVHWRRGRVIDGAAVADGRSARVVEGRRRKDEKSLEAIIEGIVGAREELSRALKLEV